jgi:undecaprenyl-diphosphatase
LTFAFTRKAGFAISLILLSLVIILGLAIADNRGQGLDNAISSALALRDGQSSSLTIAFWQGVSWTGTGIQRYIFVTALALWIWHGRSWRYGVGFALASVLSLAASEFLKASFARPRPTIVPHLDFTNNFAYPSGHATSAAVVYLLFALLVPTQKRGRWLLAAFILAFLTGVSRVILGVHWPSDVIGGWMLGSFFAIAMATILQHTERKT